MSIELAFQIDSDLLQNLFTPFGSSWSATRWHVTGVKLETGFEFVGDGGRITAK
jgi:hypothetical protein